MQFVTSSFEILPFKTKNFAQGYHLVLENIESEQLI